jgi:exopolysaccharide production protein ExoQ
MTPVRSDFPTAIPKPGDSCFGLGVTAFLAPVLLVYAPLSMAIILPAGVVIALLPGLLRRRLALRFDAATTALLIAFVAIAAASYLWAYQPTSTIEKLPRTTLTVAMGLLFIASAAALDSGGRKRVATALVAGIAAAFVALALERLLGGAFLPRDINGGGKNAFLNLFNRPLSVLSIMVWPAAAHICRNKPVAGGGLIALAFFGSLFFPTAAATLALIAGAVASLLTFFAPRAGTALTAAIVAGTVLFAPAIERNLPPPKTLFEAAGIPRSSYHRLIIWRFANEKIDERPILGWGFNQSRIIPGNKTMIDKFEDALPLHPHNAAFQWRLELGLLGALLGAGLFVAALERARRCANARVARSAATGAIAAAFTIAMLSFGAWQTWWISSLFLVAGFCVAVCGGKEPSDSG